MKQELLREIINDRMNVLVTGRPGTGMTFFMKKLLLEIAELHPKDRIVVVDPEGEFDIAGVEATTFCLKNMREDILNAYITALIKVRELLREHAKDTSPDKGCMWVFIDEIWLVLSDEYGSELLDDIIRKIRTAGGVLVISTNSFEGFFSNPYTRDILMNCGVTVLLSLSAEGRRLAKQCYGLDDAELENAERGCGLVVRDAAVEAFDAF